MFGSKRNIFNTYCNLCSVDNLFEKYQPIKFSEEEESIGKEELKKFGLKDNDKLLSQ